MRKEQQTLIVSAMINILVSVIKIVSGVVFGCYTLLASGYYTIVDLITDILAMVGASVGKKRANKKHPFGYGTLEYKLQIAIGSVIFLVGLYIAIKCFFITPKSVDLKILFIIIFVILLKVLSANYLMQKGKNISSYILVSNAKESFIDVLSIAMLIIIVIIGQYFPLVDIFGSFVIAVLIILEGIKIIFDNIILITGEDDNNKKIKSELKEIVNKINGVYYSDSFLIKKDGYYQVTIELAIDENMKVQTLVKKELMLRNKIRKSKLNIKYIDFNIIKN